MLHKDLYEDACRFIECGRSIVQRTGYNTDAIDALLDDLRKKEINATQRAQGRIESRDRFKGISSNPAMEERESMYLYLDESGTSTPFVSTSPPGHAVFSVGAVAMTKTARKKWDRGADSIKMEFWGHKEITFHEPYMRNCADQFRFGGNVGKQQAFASALRDLLSTVPYVTFGAVIRKDAYQSEFLDSGKDGFLPVDAYSLAISMILERFVDYLAHHSKRYRGRLIFESQGPRQDAEHQLSYASVMLNGTRYVPGKTFMNWLHAGCEFLPKSGSHPVEIADIVSRDLHEWVRSGCKEDPKYWDIFSNRVYYRDRGVQGTFGIKVFPASGIEVEIYDHRRKCGAAVPQGHGTVLPST